MKKIVLWSLLLLSPLTLLAKNGMKAPVEKWPDGSVMDAWFRDTTKIDVSTLGKQYVLTDYGVVAGSRQVQTQQIQAVIDRCAQEGGGVVVVPEGEFLTGALFFKQGTHLHVRESGVLKGSERIIDYPILTTRIEGETCKYFSALVNADGLNGFTISGRGTIDGNGLSYLDCYIYAPTENIFPTEPKRGAIRVDAKTLLDVKTSDKYQLEDFMMDGEPLIFEEQ